MEHRAKALVRDMIRILFWGTLLLLMLWLIIQMFEYGAHLMVEQVRPVCSGSPEDCARWAP